MNCKYSQACHCTQIKAVRLFLGFSFHNVKLKKINSSFKNTAFFCFLKNRYFTCYVSVVRVFGFGSSQSSYWPFSVLTRLLSVASCLLSVPNTLGRNIQCSKLEANTHPDCEIRGEEVRLFFVSPVQTRSRKTKQTERDGVCLLSPRLSLGKLDSRLVCGVQPEGAVKHGADS